MFPHTSRFAPGHHVLRASLSLLGSLALLAGGAGTFAGTAAAATSCPSVPLSQPFAPYGDSGYYTLVAGGSFEGPLEGWTLSGGASVVPGSEPAAATGSLGHYSLAIPPGGSASSPFMCVGAAEQMFRFFTRSEGASGLLVPQVVYKTPFGNLTVPVGLSSSTAAWAPSAIFHTGAQIFFALTGETAEVALRFSSITGTNRIDDVFLDPRLHR